MFFRSFLLVLVANYIFAVDCVRYDMPECYQSNGKQTEVCSKEWKEEVFSKLQSNKRSLEHLIQIQQWVRGTFPYRSGQGITIGKVTSEDIYHSREVRGCHDIALIFTTTARLFGYPCVFVDTMSIAWAKRYMAGIECDPQGHALVEIYLDGQWILFDPGSGYYSLKYDFQNPIIYIDRYEDEPDGFYVICKGKDNWDMGIFHLEDLMKLQKEAASSLFNSRRDNCSK